MVVGDDVSERLPLRIVALPRGRGPYQRLLYAALERGGHRVHYAGELTPSQTLNLLLLPLELAVCRAAGWRIFHVHWVFAFKLSGSARYPILRRASQRWFDLVLGISRLLGMRMVWTAHNVLPHERVFHDELVARQRLVVCSDIVLAHSRAALEELEELGIRPKRSAVVTHGPLTPTMNASSLRPPASEGGPLKLLFFGQVLEYKGVEELLEALRGVPLTAGVALLIAGRCPREQLGSRLHELAARCEGRVKLRLEHIPDAEVTEVLSAADVVLLPFRTVTTSGSLLLAMGHGRVVVVPSLPAFADLPEGSVVRYDGSVDGLRQTIVELSSCPPERLRQLGAAASTYAASLSWADAARETLTAIQGIV